MKIDSGLSGYNYPNRPAGIDRKQEEPQARETTTTARSIGTLTGASTTLAASLSKALWVMGSTDDTPSLGAAAASISQDWVQGLYQEFA